MIAITNSTFADFKTNTYKKEGIVLLGCGGDLNEWTEGVSNCLKKEKIIQDTDNAWSNIYKLETTGGRIDLAMVFNNNSNSNINIGKLAIWRLRFGDCSWISDYKDNYASQHKED